MSTGWNYFDKIYCISLAERADRRTTALKAFAAVGLSEKVEFVIVERHPTDCEQGCYESHLTCMRRGLDSGAERILIFEDDVVFDRFSPETLDHAVDFCSRHETWHLLFFGCMVKGSRRTEYPSIRSITYRSLTHAYAIRREFAEELIRRPWQGIPYDDFLRDLRDEEMYSVSPSFAFQSNARSDNVRYLPLDRFRRFMGGLQNLQKLDEFYHCHRLPIIGAHVAVLLLILWVLLK